jgi:lysophospholipase L1-like esterase
MRPAVARRAKAGRIALFSAILLVQFALFEAGLRRWGSSEAAPTFQGLFTGDAAMGYRLKPGARIRFATSEFDTNIAINNAGVRDDEEIGPKAPGERRIVILGDSLVLSVQVPFQQTFGELLEQRLNLPAKAGSHRYRVINAGVQGYGPVEELLFFRNVVRHLQPDVVLVTVFVGNDAEEAIASESKLVARPATEALKESFVTTLRRTVRRSMVLQVLRLRVVAATDRFRGLKAPPEPPLQSYAANPAPRIPRGIERTRELIAELAKDADAVGARTGILLMPARFQVDDGDYGRLREAVTQAGGELRRDAATERFTAALAPLSLPMTDLLPPLRAAMPGPDVFFQQNVHLTPRGHGIVADHLAAFVRAHGF